MARPQIGTKLGELKRHKLDIFVALDVSLSMKAEDVKPNRLEVAKNEIVNLIDQMKNDRVGLIFFSGTSFVQCPLTCDYNVVKLFLDIVDSDALPQAGTAIDKAIEKTIEAFSNTEPKYKIMLIFSDGENHSNLIESANAAAEAGIRIYTVGIGKPQGAPIPLYNNSGDLVGYKKNLLNHPVLSRLEEKVLREIARVTNGRYYSISSASKQLYDDISKLGDWELEKQQFTQYEDRSHYFIVIALILVSTELILSERVKGSTRQRNALPL